MILLLALLAQVCTAGSCQSGAARVPDGLILGEQPGRGSRAPFQSVTEAPYFAFCNGSDDDSSVIQLCLNSVSGGTCVLPAGRTCSLGVAGLTMPMGTALVGWGTESSKLVYSGSGCGITVDSVSATQLENFHLDILSPSATTAGLCYANSVGPTKWNVARHLEVFADPGNPQLAGTVGLLLSATTSSSLYYNEFDHIITNYWETSHLLRGSTSPVNGPNANFFYALNSNAAVNGFKVITNVSDNFLYGMHCNAAGTSFVQTCLVVGDGVTAVTGNSFHGIVSDQGTNGKGYTVSAQAVGTTIWASNESTVAGTDAGTSTFIYDAISNCCGNIYRMRLPSVQVVGREQVAGILSLGSGFATARRALADVGATMATSDYGLYYTSITASRTVTLESAGVGTQFQHEICDESGSASGTVKVLVLAPAGQAINGVANPTTVDCVTTAFGCCHVRSAGGTSWFKW